jgi:hypothetical protein
VAPKIFDIVVDNFNVPLEVTFEAKRFAAFAAFKIPNFVVNNFYVPEKNAFLSKFFIANAALKIFIFNSYLLRCSLQT